MNKKAKKTKPSSEAFDSDAKSSDDLENLPDPWDDDWIDEFCKSDEDEMLVMKCTKCGYEEEIPRWVIGEIADAVAESGGDATEAGIECPKCRGHMTLKST